MKRIFTLVFLLFAASAVAQQTPPAAEAVLKEATQLAAKQNKKVFIIFHASWCGWCHRMDSIMNNADCKKLFNDNFVVRHLKVKESDKNKHLENPGGEAMLTKYRGGDKGIPFWLIFDAKGKLVGDCIMGSGENTGCPATKEEVAHFTKMLKQTTSLNDQQLAVIERNFIKKN
jgi:thioredoxin-related protein